MRPFYHRRHAALYIWKSESSLQLFAIRTVTVRCPELIPNTLLDAGYLPAFPVPMPHPDHPATRDPATTARRSACVKPSFLAISLADRWEAPGSRALGRLHWFRLCPQVIRYFPDHLSISNAADSLPRERGKCFGNDPQLATARLAGIDTKTEQPLQALRPRHRGPAFGGRRRFLLHRPGFVVRTPLRRCHQHPVIAVGGKDTVESRQVVSWLWYQGCQSCDDVQWLKDHMRVAVPVRCLVLVTNTAVRRERQSLLGTAVRLMLRHSRSSFSRSSALGTMPACSEIPATKPDMSSN